MIYCIRAITGAEAWRGNETNENFGTFAVVRAASESEARDTAATECGDEGDAPWRDPSQTRAEVWEPDGPAGCIANG